MPTAKITSTTGPIELYYEETGQGFPLIWCHEYGGDFRSWEPQVRYFSRRYRVVTAPATIAVPAGPDDQPHRTPG